MYISATWIYVGQFHQQILFCFPEPEIDIGDNPSD